MGGNCLTAALMLFQEAHPSSKLGDVPLKTPCIIFLMMSPPKQSQKIIQSYRLPWRNSRLPQDQRDEIRGRSEGLLTQFHFAIYSLYDSVTDTCQP
jgi:hypothetical protein